MILRLLSDSIQIKSCKDCLHFYYNTSWISNRHSLVIHYVTLLFHCWRCSTWRKNVRNVTNLQLGFVVLNSALIVWLCIFSYFKLLLFIILIVQEDRNQILTWIAWTTEGFQNFGQKRKPKELESWQKYHIYFKEKRICIERI